MVRPDNLMNLLIKILRAVTPGNSLNAAAFAAMPYARKSTKPHDWTVEILCLTSLLIIVVGGALGYMLRS
jgi:hypothetical protein